MNPARHEELRQRYASLYGVAAEYLPSSIDGVLEWQQRVVARATAEALVDAPSVAKLRALLAADPALAAQVDAMIAEQFAIFEPDMKPPVASTEAMLACLNWIVGHAPEFEVEDPSKPGTWKKGDWFPMSALFVFMMFTPTGRVLFGAGPFNVAIRNILQAWCDFLDSPASRSVLNKTHGWLSPDAWKVMKLDEFVIPDPADPYGGFPCFNAYFHREIKRDCRPVAGRNVGMTVTSANDGTLFKIASDVQRTADIWSKDQPYALELMLDGVDGPGYSVDDFCGGHVFQSFLSGANYHRWWAPVSGTIVEQRLVDGLMFSELQVEGFDPTSGTHSQGYQASVNTRGLTFIRADWGPLKTVCVIPIGITEISSINFCRKVGDHVDKGDELGYFSYGGSTLALVFQPKTIMAFQWGWPPPDPKNPPKIQVGSQIATAEPWRE